MTDKRRKLHLNAFLMEAGHHEASWRRPDSNPRADFDLDHWIGLARLAESAKFDSLFLADGPAITGTGELRPPGQLEPLTLLTALSQATRRIGAHRDRLDDVQRSVQPGPAAGVGRSCQSWPVRLEHRHLGRG